MFHQLLNLISLHRNESLIAAVLPVFLLEHNAGDPTRFPLLGRDVLAGDCAGDCEDRLGVFRVGFGEVGEVGEWVGLGRVGLDEGGGGVGEAAEGGSGQEAGGSLEEHFGVRGWRG